MVNPKLDGVAVYALRPVSGPGEDRNSKGLGNLRSYKYELRPVSGPGEDRNVFVEPAGS